MSDEEFECGWIMIRRTSQYVNRLRQINIFIDDQKVGGVANGESKAFEVTPGQHSVFAKIDWCKAPAIEVAISAGQTETLICGSELTGLKLTLAIFYAFIPSKWIYLRKNNLDTI